MKIIALPGCEYINLDLVRRVETETEPPIAIVTWSDETATLYRNEQALAIVEALDLESEKCDDE